MASIMVVGDNHGNLSTDVGNTTADMIKQISWFLSNWRGIKVAYGAVGVFAIGARGARIWCYRCYGCNDISYYADLIGFFVRYTSVCFEQRWCYKWDGCYMPLLCFGHGAQAGHSTSRCHCPINHQEGDMAIVLIGLIC
jgi:hypothetical protein